MSIHQYYYLPAHAVVVTYGNGQSPDINWFNYHCCPYVINTIYDGHLVKIVVGSMWCRYSGEAFLHCGVHGCSNVTATADLAGVCPCNAASRRCCCGGSDNTTDTNAEVTYSDDAF